MHSYHLYGNNVYLEKKTCGHCISFEIFIYGCPCNLALFDIYFVIHKVDTYNLHNNNNVHFAISYLHVGFKLVHIKYQHQSQF